MRRALAESIDRAGWRFRLPEDGCEDPLCNREELREQMLDAVVAALEGKRGAPFRRSRRATTWKITVAGVTGTSVNLFVKELDRAEGVRARWKGALRAKRCEHVLQISAQLRRDNFQVARILVIGEKPGSGQEVIVMNQVAGFMLPRWMNPRYGASMNNRRAILRMLGREIARLHGKGYIHGDLTPYNIFASVEDSVSIAFIDHERTWRTSRATINLARERRRNLVQLGHFDIPGVTRADRLRVFDSYAQAAGLSPRARSRSMRRLARMIQRRRLRDRAIIQGEPQPAIIVEQRPAGG